MRDTGTEWLYRLLTAEKIKETNRTSEIFIVGYV